MCFQNNFPHIHIRSPLRHLLLTFACFCDPESFPDTFNRGFRVLPGAKVSTFGVGLCINCAEPLGSRAFVENSYSILSLLLWTALSRITHAELRAVSFTVTEITA